MKFILILTILISAHPGLLLIAAPASIDKVIAIVEGDVITQRELEAQKQLTLIELSHANRAVPDSETLHRQVLEAMIRDSILLQEAQGRGIKTTDGQLNQAMLKIASDNNMNLTQFRQALVMQGIDYEKYRNSLRQEITINTLRQQYTARTVTVSDKEVEEFLQQNNDNSTEYEYRLAHILIALPDAATPEQVTAARDQATAMLEELNQGASFGQLASQYSSGSNALHGGDLGWRKKAELPSLFTDAVSDMEPGEYAGPFRSASGYHIAYLSERKNARQVLTKQIRSRHILLRPNEILSEEDARLRLLEFRQRILDGDDFERLARLYSVDYNSGAEGGDIGWMSTGDTVQEYQAVIEKLPQGELSQPFRSAFGWHLVEVTGRRTVDETTESIHKKIYSQLLQQKQREAFAVWQRRLRDEAYVVIPDV